MSSRFFLLGRVLESSLQPLIKRFKILHASHIFRLKWINGHVQPWCLLQTLIRRFQSITGVFCGLVSFIVTSRTSAIFTTFTRVKFIYRDTVRGLTEKFRKHGRKFNLTSSRLRAKITFTCRILTAPVCYPFVSFHAKLKFLRKSFVVYRFHTFHL